jgi:hypothetical protein
MKLRKVQVPFELRPLFLSLFSCLFLFSFPVFWSPLFLVFLAPDGNIVCGARRRLAIGMPGQTGAATVMLWQAKKVMEQLDVQTIWDNLPASKRRQLKRLVAEE